MFIYIVERLITTEEVNYVIADNFKFMYPFKEYEDAFAYIVSWLKDVCGTDVEYDFEPASEYNYVICRRLNKTYIFRIKETRLVESLD